MKTTSGYCLRVGHGIKQKAYVEWKYSLLKEFVRTPPRQSGNSFYFRTITHPFFSDLRERFYRGLRKIVPKDFLDETLEPFALAIWAMDDGARDGKQFRLNTQSFTKDEVVWLSQFLRAKLGIETRLNHDKGKYRLRICATSMGSFIDMVKPVFHPSMLYKLSL